jgi:hypothetical protein
MLNKSDSAKALKKLFRRFPIVDLDTLCDALKTRSRMSIFRRLREIGYYSSYTHTGRYYTLEDIPQFDDYGLWHHQGVGFSQFGTLKGTIVELVNKSPTGHTHAELHHLLRIRVHNTLLSLVGEGQVCREHIERMFLYVSAESDHAVDQISRRRDQMVESQKTLIDIPTTTVIDILIETLHAGQVRISPGLVAKRLSVQGASVTVQQVEEVFARYRLGAEKKTPESGSTYSRA